MEASPVTMLPWSPERCRQFMYTNSHIYKSGSPTHLSALGSLRWAANLLKWKLLFGPESSWHYMACFSRGLRTKFLNKCPGICDYKCSASCSMLDALFCSPLCAPLFRCVAKNLWLTIFLPGKRRTQLTANGKQLAASHRRGT